MADDELFPGKGAYHVVFSREADGAWIVWVKGHRHEIHSFARSLKAARENIRDALSLWYDDAETAELIPVFELSPELKARLRDLGKLRDRHQKLEAEFEAKRRAVIDLLQSDGVGTRDIADMVELSQQRVSQISRGVR